MALEVLKKQVRRYAGGSEGGVQAEEPVAPETSPETSAAPALSSLEMGRQRLNAQIEKLKQSLEKRLNPPFDPMMMKMAAGFLAPTKTGSFGESLGYAAQGASEEAEKGIARRSEIEKMQFELEQKQYDLARQAEASRMLGAAVSGNPLSGAPTGAAPSIAGVSGPVAGTATAPLATATGGADTQQVSPQQAAVAVKQNPNIMDQITMTPEVVAAITAVDPAYGKIAESIFQGQLKKAQLLKDRYTTNAQGDVYDNFTGEWKEKGQRSIEVASPFDPDRTMKMPVEVAEQYNKLDFTDTAKVNDFLRKHGLASYAIGKEASPTATTSPAGATGVTPTGGTKLEQETESKIKTAKTQAYINQDIKDREIITNRNDSANNIINDATTVYNYAKNPETSKTFGILASPGAKNAFFTLLKDPVHVNNMSIGIGNIEDTIRKAKGTQAEINAAAALQQPLATLHLGFTQTFQKGQGSISNQEQRLSASVGPMLEDSAQVAMLKSEMIIARGKFDQLNAEKYQAWSKQHPDEYVQDYKQSPEYKQLVKHYDDKLRDIQKVYLPNLKKVSP